MIEQASLVLGNGNWAVKSDNLLGYKTIDGKYYAREMDFTRATTGTRVNAAGLVELVPYNLLSWSEEFDNAAWTKSNVTIIANNTTAPNGTLTADKLYPISSGNFRHVRQSAFSPYTGLNTMSIYAKKAELSNITLLDYDGSGAGINFNLDTGVATDFATVPFISYSMTSVGDGWYRCTATALNGYFYWMVTDGGNSVAVTANGTDGIYIWGAQLVEGTEPFDYLPTTDRLDISRIDYSTGDAALLLEPQRTNINTQSEDISIWSRVATTATINTTTAPNGMVTADSLLETTATTSHITFKDIVGLSGTQYTFSIYAKSIGGRNIQVLGSSGFSGSIVVDLSNGNILSGSGVVSNMGDGWFRISITATTTTTTVRAIIYTVDGTTNSFAGDVTKGLYLWGAQLEAGAYATSYIPTTTASVTRNADIASKTGISSLIGQTEGTLFVDFNAPNVVGFGIQAIVSLNNTNFINAYINNSGAILADVYVNGTYTFSLNGGVINSGQIKLAISYKSGDYKMYANGQLKASNANATILTSTISNIELKNTIAKGSFNSLQLYKTALTNDQLAQLTTL